MKCKKLMSFYYASKCDMIIKWFLQIPNCINIGLIRGFHPKLIYHCWGCWGKKQQWKILQYYIICHPVQRWNPLALNFKCSVWYRCYMISFIVTSLGGLESGKWLNITRDEQNHIININMTLKPWVNEGFYFRVWNMNAKCSYKGFRCVSWKWMNIINYCRCPANVNMDLLRSNTILVLIAAAFQLKNVCAFVAHMKWELNYIYEYLSGSAVVPIEADGRKCTRNATKMCFVHRYS